MLVEIPRATRAAREGRYDDAVGVLEAVALEGRLTPPATVLLADLYLRSERAADAVTRLAPLIAVEPHPDGFRVTIARALLAVGDPHAAIRHLTAEGRARDGDAGHQELLGQALIAGADLPAARRAFNRAIDLDAARFEARLGLARLTGRERVAEVLAAWAADLHGRAERSPDDPMLRAELGRVLALAGRSTHAEQAARDALAIAPALPEANLTLARLMLADGRVDEAVLHLQTVLKSVRRHRQANLWLAEHYEGTRQPARAASHLEATYPEPRPVDVNLRLASLYAQDKKLDQALVFASTAIRDAPASAPAHTILGRVHRLRGDRRAAAAAYGTAFTLDRELTAAHLDLDPDTAGPEDVRAAVEAR
jgi:predicted Zn-dependent protease